SPPAHTKKTSRDHLRIIEDQHVSFAQEARQVTHDPVFQRVFLRPDNEHPRGITRPCRAQRDQFFRQFEIEIGNAHQAPFTSMQSPRASLWATPWACSAERSGGAYITLRLIVRQSRFSQEPT